MNRQGLQLCTAFGLFWLLACGIVPAAEKNGQETSLAVGVNLTSGNSDTLTANASVRTSRSSQKQEWTVSAEGNYGEADTEIQAGEETRTETETTTQNAKGAFRYKLRFDRTYAYNDDSIVHDDIAGIDFRLIAGLGGGLYAVKAENLEIGVEAGAAYVREELAEDEDDDFVALRFAARHEQDLSETAKVWESIEYLPRADDWDDYLVNAEAGVQAALNSHLNLRVVVQDRYDSIPPGDSERNELAVIGSIVIML